MIRTLNQINASGPWGAGTFSGRVEDSPNLYWQSALPDMKTFVDNIKADPASAFQTYGMDAVEQYYNRDTVTAFDAAWLQVSDLGAANLVSATRNMVGLMVQSVGMLSRTFSLMQSMFSENTSIAMTVLNVVSAIVNSSAFTMAINAIGVIPVIGWIIKAVVEVAKVIVNIVEAARQEDIEAAYRSIAKRISVPAGAIEFETNVDQQEMRELFGYLSLGTGAYDPQDIIRPAYDGDPNAFQALGVHSKDTERGTSNVKLASGWVVVPGNPTGGFGLTPGTGNLSRSLFFPTGLSSGPGGDSKGCAPAVMRDLGSLYPTAQGAANTWWSMVVEEGPAMFQVQPLLVKDEWADLIESMLVLVQNTLEGWTCCPSGIPWNNKFDCVPEVYGVGNCGDAGHKSGVQTFPSDFGLDPHTSTAGYIYRLFFALKSVNDRFAYYDPDEGRGLPLVNDNTYISDEYGKHVIKWPTVDAFDIDQSVPLRALDNLFDRQMATLKSPYCMYVDGEQENRDRFPAFNNAALRAQWNESVTAIINGPDWSRIVPDDVPESRMKEHLLRRIRDEGYDPATFNPPCPPGAGPGHPGCQIGGLSAGPSVLGDPAPPPPPPTNDVPIDPRLVKIARPSGPGGGGKKGGGGGMIVLAAAAAAMLAMRKR